MASAEVQARYASSKGEIFKLKGGCPGFEARFSEGPDRIPLVSKRLEKCLVELPVEADQGAVKPQIAQLQGPRARSHCQILKAERAVAVQSSVVAHTALADGAQLRERHLRMGEVE